MEIQLQQIGKRFNRKWIVRHVDLELEAKKNYLIRGANGSGKSTVLKMIAGFLSPSEGTRLVNGEKSGPLSDDHKAFVMVAPYLELYTDMSLQEAVDFHFSFKKRGADDIKLMLEDLKLPLNKSLKGFSSGMLQRVKLSLAFCTESPFLLLDEPVMNLDEEGVAWFKHQLAAQRGKRTIVVASNETPEEMEGAEQSFVISQGTVKKS